MKAYMKNINIYVELTSLDQIRSVITCLKARQIRIYEVDIERGREERIQVLFFMFASQNRSRILR